MKLTHWIDRSPFVAGTVISAAPMNVKLGAISVNLEQITTHINNRLIQIPASYAGTGIIPDKPLADTVIQFNAAGELDLLRKQDFALELADEIRHVGYQVGQTLIDASALKDAAFLYQQNAAASAAAAVLARTDSEGYAQAAMIAVSKVDGYTAEAKTSAETAKNYAKAALDASVASKDSESKASAYAAATDSYAQAALTAQTLSQQAANSAGLYASTSTEGANAALSASTKAKQYAEDASGAKTQAETFAQAAVTAATSADGSASVALTAKTDIEQIKTDAQGLLEQTNINAEAAIEAATAADGSASVALAAKTDITQINLDAQQLLTQTSIKADAAVLAATAADGSASAALSAKSEVELLKQDAEGLLAQTTIKADAAVSAATAADGSASAALSAKTQVDQLTARAEIAATTASDKAEIALATEFRIDEAQDAISAVEQRMTAAELEAFYSLKVSANGKVAGFGASADPEATRVYFEADTFEVRGSDGVADLFLDTVDNKLTFRGKLVLGDEVVSSKDELKGDAAAAYSLQCSATVLKRDDLWHYTPPSLQVSLKRSVGDSAPTDIPARFLIADTADGINFTPQYISNGPEISASVVPSVGITAVKVSAFNSENKLLDEQLIPVLVDGLKGEQGEQGITYDIFIESSNGDTFRPGTGFTTVLSARVFKNGIEVTSQLSPAQFRWKRKSSIPMPFPDDDATWNAAHTAGYQSVVVSADDVYARAVFTCEVSD